MDILDKLKMVKNDPLWPDHSEISKKTLGRAIDEIERLRAQAKRHEAELRASAPSPVGLGNPEAPKPNDKYTFVFPDASMTKIRYIFVDGEMVYENLESEQ